MKPATAPTGLLSDPVTRRMQTDFSRLNVNQTVGQALAWLRQHPPVGRIIYFYVLDDADRLQGVVPTRRLVLSAPEAPLADIMIAKTIAIPAEATVLDACEFFIQHRLLAFPVVDDQRRMLGVVDIDLYTDELHQLEQATPVGRLVAPFVRFLHVEASGGLVLLACTALALLLANSPWAAAFHALWEIEVGLRLGDFALIKPLHFWVDDGLMALFFFVVGLEIKREIVAGELADIRKALLPIVAAVGGMAAPALLYVVGLWGRAGANGWGVPMATDIAFVVGFLTLLGPRVPAGLKILLLTLAIADDLGAVLVIAVVYSKDFDFVNFLLAAGGFGLIVLLRWSGVRTMALYAVVGIAIWLAVLRSGVHPTIAGVLLGLLTPARPLRGQAGLLDVVGDLFARRRGAQRGAPYAAEAISPAEKLEHVLHPWVAFLIMPIFALANAGIALKLQAITSPIALAVIAGLVVGKPLGIVLFSWISVKLGVTRLPEGIDWRVMLGAGSLAGIGFTMSLFIAGLAFEDASALLDDAKLGVLAASALSALLGCGLLLAFLPTSRR